MRILHTSDWHLGRTLHGVDLREYQAAFIDHLVEVVAREQVDAILIAGDVYDRAIPPVESVLLLNSALARLSAHTTVIVSSGNHDSPARLGFGADLLRESVVIRSKVDGIAEPVELTGRDGTHALVYAFPYLEPDLARVVLSEDLSDDGLLVPLPRSHEAVTAAAMRRVRADVDRRRSDPGAPEAAVIVMAHAFVVGGAASESERDIRVGGVDSVPAGVFEGADYVALGHLHGPQKVTLPEASLSGKNGLSQRRAPIARYSGSPLAYSFSERNHVKSSVLIELDGAGVVGELQLIPVPVQRKLSQIVASLDEVLSDAYLVMRDDWVKVILTDDQAPSRYLERVREAFPHALVVLRQPTAKVREGSEGLREVTPASSPTDVATGFIEYVTEHSATDGERAILEQVFIDIEREARSR